MTFSIIKNLRHATLVFLVIWTPLLYGSTNCSCVTYEFSGGRFGDNLLAYLHAKWISYRYQIPLLYKPFPLSSELVLDDIEIPFHVNAYRKLRDVYMRSEPDEMDLSNKYPLLLVCPYFPESQWDRENLKGPNEKPWFYFHVDWKDPEFRKTLEELVALKQPTPLTLPPKDRISIAIHFREGGGYDKGNFALEFFTKFPPLSFYIEGLLKVVELFENRPLYCYLFTDALNPDEIIEQFRNALPYGAQITFECRSKNNHHTQNVLSDFFSLFHFDVLIHSQSNFSLIPSLIHEYAATYSPLSGYRNGSIVTIDKTKFEINEKLYRKLTE